MGIPAAGSGTVDEVMAVAEHLNETLRFHVAVHDFLSIVFSHRGQQIKQLVVDVLIASHVPVRAIHLPKKRDDLWGLSVSCFSSLLMLICLLHKKTPATCVTRVELYDFICSVEFGHGHFSQRVR